MREGDTYRAERELPDGEIVEVSMVVKSVEEKEDGSTVTRSQTHPSSAKKIKKLLLEKGHIKK